MSTVWCSDAAELAIEELATSQPDGGIAMRRELESVERVLSILPRSGKEVSRRAGISLRKIISPSGCYQVIYFYDSEDDVIEIENVVSTRSSLKQ